MVDLELMPGVLKDVFAPSTERYGANVFDGRRMRAERNAMRNRQQFKAAYSDKERLKNKNAGVLIKKSQGRSVFGITWYNDREFRQGESPSAGTLASARGLAKLGAYMSNKGTFDGETLIS